MWKKPIIELLFEFAGLLFVIPNWGLCTEPWYLASLRPQRIPAGLPRILQLHTIAPSFLFFCCWWPLHSNMNLVLGHGLIFLCLLLIPNDICICDLNVLLNYNISELKPNLQQTSSHWPKRANILRSLCKKVHWLETGWHKVREPGNRVPR